MKLFFATLTLFFGLNVFAQVELGKYHAVDADTQNVNADFELAADGTLKFVVTSNDNSVPETKCTGNYTVEGVVFAADLKCDSTFLPSANVMIDVTNVNPQSLRSERGAEVNVVIDALGGDPILFLLKKADTP